MGIAEAAAAGRPKGYLIPDMSGLRPWIMPNLVHVQYKKPNYECSSSQPSDLSALLLIFSVSPVFPLPLLSFFAYIVHSVHQILKVQSEINKIICAACLAGHQ